MSFSCYEMEIPATLSPLLFEIKNKDIPPENHSSALDLKMDHAATPFDKRGDSYLNILAFIETENICCQ